MCLKQIQQITSKLCTQSQNLHFSHYYNITDDSLGTLQAK